MPSRSELVISAAIACLLSVPAVAQGSNLTPSNFQLLYTAAESKGSNIRMHPLVAADLGMQVEAALPCRLVISGAQGVTVPHEAAVRSLLSFQYQSHQYLLLRLRSGTNHWQFLVDDAGNSTAALHAIGRGGWHTLTSSDAQPLVAAEEAFWLKWVVDWPLP